LAGEEKNRETQMGMDYLRLALSLTGRTSPRMVITHGLSGSGKTTFSQQLIMQYEMIGLRSDIERKRLAGLDALAKSGSGMESGIYTRDFSRRTYEHLAGLAEKLLQAGWSVLIDATFIARWQRELFRQLAERCNVPLHILDFDLPEEILRQRVHARSAEGRDASEADVSVLEQQLKTHEPLASEETEFAIRADSVESVVTKLKGKQC
jgi:predicted kinase